MISASNENPPTPNVALREHVTSGAFLLSLKKTHVWVLEAVAHDDRGRTGRRAGVSDHFITAVKALERRGLVEHRNSPNFVDKKFGGTADPLTHYYRLTRAGWLVFDLLAEAGMVESLPARSAKRRKVA